MLTHDEVLARLTGVFRNTFNDDAIEISDATTAADIEEWDSLAHITLILGVEREFKIKFKAAEVGSFANVGEMIGMIGQRGGATT
jgi:acyl carrier protein